MARGWRLLAAGGDGKLVALAPTLMKCGQEGAATNEWHANKPWFMRLCEPAHRLRSGPEPADGQSVPMHRDNPKSAIRLMDNA